MTSRGASHFDAAEYWENRLSQSYGLHGVGCAGLGQSFNEWMYRIRRRAFLRLVRSLVEERDHAEVLDVGSGTGFYVDLWRELGVQSITASDISETAVAALKRRYPGHEAIRLDIGDDVDALEGRKFDLVSAFDVLYHLVEDDRYERALRNIRGLLRPHGYFVFSENFLRGATIRRRHQISRRTAEIEHLLRVAGLELVERRPLFYLMNEPVDSPRRWHLAWWHILTGVLTRREGTGRLLGPALYPIELGVVSLARGAPSTQIALCRRGTLPAKT